MRTLNKNKVKFWMVYPLLSQDKLDSDGFLTGEKIKVYSSPVIIYLNSYPTNGKIVEQIFGKDQSFDKVAVSNEVVLTKDTLLFEHQPLVNYDTTYDYKVDAIKHSINTYNYGLRSRV